MDTVEITWDQGFIRWKDTGTSTRLNLDGSGFYCLLISYYDKTSQKWRDFKLLYIGKAFDQTLRQRIMQPHDADSCIDSWLGASSTYDKVAMIGVVTRTSLARATQGLYDDAECCLIYSNKPTCNAKCKDSYSGREIQVVNIGDYSPLRSSSHCP